jgi:hypothetical protein
MSASGIIFMIIVLGIVWGGFIYSLRVAMRKEHEKENV